MPSIALALGPCGVKSLRKENAKTQVLLGILVRGTARASCSRQSALYSSAGDVVALAGSGPRYKARCYCRSFFHERVGVGFLMCCGAITMLEKYGAIVAVENKGLNSKVERSFHIMEVLDGGRDVAGARHYVPPSLNWTGLSFWCRSSSSCTTAAA